MKSSALEQRARRIRSNALVRAWEYRQRHHAKGTWFRLRRLLAAAESCWVIQPHEADALLAEGYESEKVGAELAPPKTIMFVPSPRRKLVT